MSVIQAMGYFSVTIYFGIQTTILFRCSDRLSPYQTNSLLIFRSRLPLFRFWQAMLLHCKFLGFYCIQSLDTSKVRKSLLSSFRVSSWLNRGSCNTPKFTLSFFLEAWDCISHCISTILGHTHYILHQWLGKSGFYWSLLNRRVLHRARLRIEFHSPNIQVSRVSRGSICLIMVLSSSVEDSELSECAYGFNQNKSGFHGYPQQARFSWK
jgi:hypothetical protein